MQIIFLSETISFQINMKFEFFFIFNSKLKIVKIKYFDVFIFCFLLKIKVLILLGLHKTPFFSKLSFVFHAGLYEIHRIIARAMI